MAHIYLLKWHRIWCVIPKSHEIYWILVLSNWLREVFAYSFQVLEMDTTTQKEAIHLLVFFHSKMWKHSNFTHNMEYRSLGLLCSVLACKFHKTKVNFERIKTSAIAVTNDEREGLSVKHKAKSFDGSLFTLAQKPHTAHDRGAIVPFWQYINFDYQGCFTVKCQGLLMTWF